MESEWTGRRWPRRRRSRTSGAGICHVERQRRSRRRQVRSPEHPLNQRRQRATEPDRNLVGAECCAQRPLASFGEASTHATTTVNLEIETFSTKNVGASATTASQVDQCFGADHQSRANDLSRRSLLARCSAVPPSSLALPNRFPDSSPRAQVSPSAVSAPREKRSLLTLACPTNLSL